MNDSQPDKNLDHKTDVEDGLDEDEYANELVRFHQQVQNSDAQRLEHGREESYAFNADSESRGYEAHTRPTDVGSLASAKRVIELLARAKPKLSAVGIETRIGVRNSDTPIDGPSEIGNEASNPIPSMIGRFEIRSLIGQGGFGLVFSAYDPELGREVALKVPQIASLLDVDAQARFTREGKVLAALNHPGIVPVYEVGNDGPIAFIASELVPGLNLSQFVKEHGVCDATVAARIVADLADAIQHAHSRGVIHRDLKPANALLESSEQPAEGRVRVADFGLAKLLEEVDQGVTRTGSLMGTPAFAAPEQICGDPIETTASVDVYSLGGILYFLLTGTPPFSTENVAEAIHQVKTQPPVSLLSLAPKVPADLAAISMKCLEKSPEDRYTTAHDLLLDLGRFCNSEPVLARPVSMQVRFFRWCCRNRLIAALASTTLLTLVIGLIATAHLARVARHSAAVAKESADAERSLNEDYRKQVAATKKVIDEYFVDVTENPAFISPAFGPLKRELLESALGYYETFLVENADASGLELELINVYQRLGDSHVDDSDLETARQYYDRAIAIAKGAEGNVTDLKQLRSLNAKSLTKLGGLKAMQGNASSAEARMVEALGMQRTALEVEPSDRKALLAFCWTSQKLVGLLRNQGRFDEVLVACAEQIDLLDRAMAITPLSSTLENHLAMALGSQGVAARRTQDNDLASKVLNRSIKISRRLVATQPVPIWFAETVPTTLTSRALLRYYSGDSQGAVEDLREAVATLDGISIVETSPAFVSTNVATKNRLAAVLQQAGKEAESRAILEALVDEMRNLVEVHPDVREYEIELLGVLLNRASGLTQRLQVEEALQLTQEIEERLPKLKEFAEGNRGVQNHETTNLILMAKARFYMRRFDDAQALYNRALSNKKLQLDANPDDSQIRAELAVLQGNRAFNLVKLERYDDAIEARREALKWDLVEHQTMNKLFLADTLVAAGETGEARELVAEVELAWAGSEGVRSEMTLDAIPASELMQMAFVKASLASKASVTAEKESTDVGNAKSPNPDMAQAERLFLDSVAKGYFEDRPEKIEFLAMRRDLASLFSRPAIRKAIEGPKSAWFQSQSGKFLRDAALDARKEQ